MTLKEKVAELQPEELDSECYGGIKKCPFEYPFLQVKRNCPYNGRFDFEKICPACWNREYIEPEVQDA